MRGISVVRRLVNTRNIGQISSSSSIHTKIKTLASSSSAPKAPSQSVTHPSASFHFPQFSYRNYSSPSPSGPSNIVLVESEEQFNTSIRKVKDNSQPALYYFTAVWCPPCKLLSPIIGQLSEKYPHVTTYKVDIDHKELGNVLSKLDINSVPTLHFFHNGEKASEVVGADVERIKHTMEKLYN